MFYYTVIIVSQCLMFKLSTNPVIHFMEQDGEDAYSLLTGKSKDEGGSEGIDKTLAKIVGAGLLDSAAKTMSGFNNNLQGALTPITQPIPGIVQLGTETLNILGGLELLGEKKKLNMNAQAQEIVGNLDDREDDGYASGSEGGEASEGGDDDFHSQSQYGNMFDESHQDFGDAVGAAQNILSSGDDHEYSMPTSGMSIEHHDDISSSQPSYSPQIPQQSSGMSHDD